MAITATDIQFRFSVKAGSAGDTTAGTAAGSLGRYVSTTQPTDNTLNNLFDDVTGDENAASDVEYRCLFFLNNHGTLTLQNAVAWLSAEVSGGATQGLGVDPTAISAKGAAGVQAVEVVDENTAPAGVTFSAYASVNTKATGLALGNIGPGQVKAVWVRRTAANTAAVDNDGVTVNIGGDTAA